jgi:hypothetical protein
LDTFVWTRKLTPQCLGVDRGFLLSLSKTFKNAQVMNLIVDQEVEYDNR